MTHYLAELYSPKPQWLALDQAARLQFFEAVGAGLQALSELGVEAITLGQTDATTLLARSTRSLRCGARLMRRPSRH